MKFKKGDRVKIKSWAAMEKEYGINCGGNIRCTFSFTTNMKHLCGRTARIIDIKGPDIILDFDDKSGDIRFNYSTDMIEPVNETIVIYRKDNKVIALNKGTGKRAEARCCPEDEFNFETGAKLAFERLLKPEFYNGKVVCIKRENFFITQGKIYEFKDGISVNDAGERFPATRPIHTPEELNSIMWSKFIEVVE